MSEARKSLDVLGLEFRTDKASSGHDYLRFYERFVAARRDERVTLLEVGVFRGASLKVWEAYFPNGKIVGADIDPTTAMFAQGRVVVELADQSNLEDLVRVGIKHGPFDVVIDDGSHFWEHQTTTLRTLFPFVKDGGLYIVEDLHTNYGEIAEDFRGVATSTCMDYLKRLVDLRVADSMIDIGREEDAFLRTYGRAMHAITFYRRACLIEKSLPRGREPLSAAPFVPVPPDEGYLPVLLVAHIGHVGDRVSPIGCLRMGQDGQNIQGYSLTLPRGGGALQYSARLANGDWTEWVELGAYAGTRGMGQDLTGFAVRLVDADRGRFELQAVGKFVGGSELVVCGDGEACVPPSGRAALAGMQVVLRPRDSTD